ncbi:MAG: diguanylate cyclase [Pirellulales bacterium]
MDNASRLELEARPPDATGKSVPPTEQRISELSVLLEDLEGGATHADASQESYWKRENQLIQVRLGIASSLFTALRCKHPGTASHSLRVALGCSSWSLMMGLAGEERDAIEVASLLHDVGKIGIPESILLKAGPLSADETAVLDGHVRMGVEILQVSCASQTVLEIVNASHARYDGNWRDCPLARHDIPLGARMLAIMNAFDSMTTGHVSRPAVSRERAFSELFNESGRQFDPDLLKHFAEVHECDPLKLREKVVHRWLHAFEPELVNASWRLSPSAAPPTDPMPQGLFQHKLLENMYDAVAFVDGNLRVLFWNRGAERLTGIASASVRDRVWMPSLLEMRDERGALVRDEDCPVKCVIRTGVQALRRLTICSRNGGPVAVDAHAVPVVSSDGTMHGATLLLHDASSETSLEARCHSLNEKATKDPLTQVGNRAEFDNVHRTFITAHLQRRLPCSLVICDIDHFKQVNDQFGHQAGDEVIKCLATVLKNSCRPGDLVARYGGEEFVLLCADCTNAVAVERAEQVRKTFGEIRQPMLQGRCVTASFGVTEIQPGDTPATMLRRADRALFSAKANGRNAVVQLGTGLDDAPPSAGQWLRWRKTAAEIPDRVLEQDLVTAVPLKMAIEKLRGFVADHHAQIISIKGVDVRLRMDDERASATRRNAERAIGFLVDLRFEEQIASTPGARSVARTKIHVVITPQTERDRRQSNLADRARQVLISFRSYLMASEEPWLPPAGMFRRVKRILTPWLTPSEPGKS